MGDEGRRGRGDWSQRILVDALGCQEINPASFLLRLIRSPRSGPAIPHYVQGSPALRVAGTLHPSTSNVQRSALGHTLTLNFVGSEFR